MSDLTFESLRFLLARLDPDEPTAADKYEELRLKLLKGLIWKGCLGWKAEALADIILDRVAAKLQQGVEIENVSAYSYQILQFVWLEHRRKDKEDGYDDEKMPEIAVEPVHPEDEDVRLKYLRSCLVEITSNDADRRLILAYYDSEDEEKIKNQRKSMAEKLGLKANALKVKVFRLRERLEKCIAVCVQKHRRVTDS